MFYAKKKKNIVELLDLFLMSFIYQLYNKLVTISIRMYNVIPNIKDVTEKKFGVGQIFFTFKII